jgi:hypothetical protein
VGAIGANLRDCARHEIARFLGGLALKVQHIKVPIDANAQVG